MAVYEWDFHIMSHVIKQQKRTCSSLLRRPRVSPIERMTPGRARAVWPRSPGLLDTDRPYGCAREYGLDMEVMTVGWTIHCRSWLVVMALMVGIKALLEPGMSTLYFCRKNREEKVRGVKRTEICFSEEGVDALAAALEKVSVRDNNNNDTL